MAEKKIWVGLGTEKTRIPYQNDVFVADLKQRIKGSGFPVALQFVDPSKLKLSLNNQELKDETKIEALNLQDDTLIIVEAPQQATSQQQDLSEKVNNLVDQFANLSSSIYAFMNKSSESQAFFKQTLLNYYQMENAKCIFTGVENPTAVHLIPKSSMLEEDARQLLENVLKNNLHSPLNGLFLADYLEQTLDLALWIPILDGTHLRIKVAKDLDLIPSDQKIVVPLCSSQNNPVPSHLISKLKNTLKDYPISIDLGNKLPAPEVLKWLERRFEFYLKKRNLLRPEKQ